MKPEKKIFSLLFYNCKTILNFTWMIWKGANHGYSNKTDLVILVPFSFKRMFKLSGLN